MDIKEILSWAGIVLAAGFVGYFGRYAAKRVIARLERRRQEEQPAAPPQGTGKPDAKAGKKQAKAAAKTAKKTQKN